MGYALHVNFSADVVFQPLVVLPVGALAAHAGVGTVVLGVEFIHELGTPDIAAGQSGRDVGPVPAGDVETFDQRFEAVSGGGIAAGVDFVFFQRFPVSRQDLTQAAGFGGGGQGLIQGQFIGMQSGQGQVGREGLQGG